jgi:ribosomal protein S18 acetylase RimI-like enzyme
MSIELRVMSDAELEEFLHRSRAEYVSDLVASGMSEEAAGGLADKQLTHCFPSGRPAPGHHVCAVIELGRQVGSVWFGPELTPSEGRWVLWDIAVDEPERGRGVGGGVLLAVEAEIRRLGGTVLGLSVFGHNDAARRLYERSGYEVASVTMQKHL